MKGSGEGRKKERVFLHRIKVTVKFLEISLRRKDSPKPSEEEFPRRSCVNTLLAAHGPSSQLMPTSQHAPACGKSSRLPLPRHP